MSNKKEAVLDLTGQIGTRVLVKCNGGREIRGILRGYDILLNLTLDECTEYLKDPTDSSKEITRELGHAILRGPSVASICPLDGFSQLESSPFEE